MRPTNKGISSMRRLVIIAALVAVSAPLLSGCIIIATDKPTTRVVSSSTSEPSE
jgi:hypothetical protein